MVPDGLKPYKHMLVLNRSNPGIGGHQWVLKVGNWGLSVIDSPEAHIFPYAYEAAVLRFDGEGGWNLNNKTPLSADVEVFSTPEEFSEWVKKAVDWMEANPVEPEVNEDSEREEL